MLAALSVGVPLIVMPVAADQPENADRCVAAGVGVTLGTDERDPASVRRAVELVLGTPVLRGRRGAGPRRDHCHAAAGGGAPRARAARRGGPVGGVGRTEHLYQIGANLLDFRR